MNSKPDDRLAWRSATACGLLATLLLPGTATSGDGWLRNGVAFSGARNVASSQGFAIMQVATIEPERLMSDWNRPGEGVRLPSSTAARRNQPIVTFLVFRGCRADRTGNCNVTADFETTAPNGKTYDRTKGVRIWVGYPPPPGASLQLSADAYGLRFEDKDPLGTYSVRATVTDNVARITLRTEQVLTARK